MVAFREGNNHPAGTPVSDVVRYTPGKYVALNQSPIIGSGVAMCSVDGERCDFIFNDTRAAGRGLPGVGLMSPIGSSEPADAIRALAGGVIADRDYLVIKISETDDLPKFIRAADGNPGDWVVARANFGNAAAAEDVADANGIFHPSITVFLLGQQSYQLGVESATDTFPTAIELATIAADDEVLVRWVPGYAGTILSDYFQVTDAAATALKTVTLKLFINGVQVTGGTIVLTTANVVQGAIVNGTAITALNVFDANDEITVVSDDTTAFVEGAGTIVLRVTSPTSQV